MKKEMLINVLQPEECRIAIIEDGVLEELYVERTSLESFTGNIYKGKVVNLEPAIQAAFVDFSVGRNGFLHVSDVEPQYYNRHAPKSDDDSPAPPRRDRERDRDRERPERRPPTSRSIVIDPDAPVAPPSYPEDRVRDRDRDRPERPERGRDRDRERPDRSEKGRRDRSSRGFGEGLDDILFTPAPRPVENVPPPPPPPPVPPPTVRRAAADLDRERDEPRRRSEYAPPVPRVEEPVRTPEPVEEPVRPRRGEPAGFGEEIRSRRPEPVGFEPEEPRSRRSEAPAYEPEEPRARRPEPTSFEPEEPRSRRAEPSAYEPQETRSRRAPEPFDPDLPPSRTQRGRTTAPPSRVPVEDEPRARTPLPPPVAREPGPSIDDDAPAPARERDRDRERDPRRRSRGRGGRPSPADPIVEAEAPPPIVERDLDLDFPPAREAPIEDVDLDPIVDEDAPPRRRGRDAIRSRGTDRERERVERDVPRERERDRDREREPRETPRPAPPNVERERDRERERTRPVSPERAPEIEPERSRPAAAERERERDRERPRAVEPERTRAVEPERPRERDRDRERDKPREPERRRAVEAEAPRPAPAAPVVPAPTARDRDRDRDRDKEPAKERERGSKPVDRAGEEGYVPRRMRGRGAEPALEDELRSWSDVEDELEPIDALEPSSTDELDADADEAGDERGGRRRRRRRGRRRGERETTRPTSAPADLDAGEDADADLEFDEPAPVRSRAQAGDDFDFDEHDDDVDDRHHDDFDDDDLDDDAPPRTVSAEEDRIDPELEEEIRKEIEEIAALELEMGLRGTTEARPRRGDAAGDGDEGGRGGKFSRGRGTAKPPLQDIFRRGDEVLVQVIKESIGTKGPTLSTYISIPGRYLVLMPGLNRVGVSRKIADEGQRRKLREIMNELNPPKGLGFIVRTAGLDRTKRELARDLAYLLRLWKVILRRIKKAKGPTPIYQESDMITRTIRDIFNAEIDTIWIDEKGAFERAQEFLRVVMPRFVNRLKFYEEKVPLFHKYGIEEEIAKIQRRTVPLPEGGSIVIDQTEALVAIDVNSGNFRVENDAERTAYEMNLRAAKEIARQLRLRDMGGVIVNDFIDMREERNRRGVEKALRDAIKRDRARTKILRMSQFGLIEMTRQRIRPSLKRSVYQDCRHCAGQGVVKTVESMSIDVMRLLALASHREEVRRVQVGVASSVATYINNRKRQEIARIEAENGMHVHVQADEEAPVEHLQLECFDANNNEVRVLPPPTPSNPRRGGGGHHH